MSPTRTETGFPRSTSSSAMALTRTIPTPTAMGCRMLTNCSSMGRIRSIRTRCVQASAMDTRFSWGDLTRWLLHPARRMRCWNASSTRETFPVRPNRRARRSRVQSSVCVQPGQGRGISSLGTALCRSLPPGTGTPPRNCSCPWCAGRRSRSPCAAGTTFASNLTRMSFSSGSVPRPRIGGDGLRFPSSVRQNRASTTCAVVDGLFRSFTRGSFMDCPRPGRGMSQMSSSPICRRPPPQFMAGFVRMVSAPLPVRLTMPIGSTVWL